VLRHRCATDLQIVVQGWLCHTQTRCSNVNMIVASLSLEILFLSSQAKPISRPQSSLKILSFIKSNFWLLKTKT
jgi:hypothetical protein